MDGWMHDCLKRKTTKAIECVLMCNKRIAFSMFFTFQVKHLIQDVGCWGTTVWYFIGNISMIALLSKFQHTDTSRKSHKPKSKF